MMNEVITLKKELELLLSELEFKTNVVLEIPKDDKFGDYTTNVAMRIGKGDPMGRALEIKRRLEARRLKFVDRIEVIKPGFVNFYFSTEHLSNSIKSLLSKSEKVAKTGQTIVVEYTDPNPFKEFHIGHLFNNIVGESIARISEWQGNTVYRLCYQGDVGLHVAKAVYGIIHKLGQDSVSELEKLENEPLDARAKLLGEAYAAGDRAYTESPEAKEAINRLNKQIYSQDPEIINIYKKGREWSLEYFDRVYKRLGTTFDKFYFESESGPKGVEIVKDHVKDGIFEVSEGATIFDGEKYGLHKRVFINSLDLPTYEAKELGLAVKKFDDFHYDGSIIVTAKEVSDYFKVIFKALSLIYPDLASKTTHIGHGFIKLPEGKMSSRTGNIIRGEDLLNDVVSKVSESFPDMDSETAEKVGVGAVKYSLLKSAIGNDVVFNIDESISLEGNSGPYLQYTFARCQSVLAKKSGEFADFKTGPVSDQDMSLLKKVAKFENIFLFTDNFSQHTLCTYLYELASNFNLFYQKNPILKSENEDFRLSLTKATSKVLEQGLFLLGIEAPVRM